MPTPEVTPTHSAADSWVKPAVPTPEVTPTHSVADIWEKHALVMVIVGADPLVLVE